MIPKQPREPLPKVNERNFCSFSFEWSHLSGQNAKGSGKISGSVTIKYVVSLTGVYTELIVIVNYAGW